MKLQTIWERFKLWRRLRLGGVSMVFRFERAIRVSRGSLDAPPRVPARLSQRSRSRGFIDLADAPARDAAAGCRSPAGTAVLVGVGPGFGYALARKLAAEQFNVVLVSRDSERLDPLLAELLERGANASTVGCDATDEAAVERLFEQVTRLCGAPTLVTYLVQGCGPGELIDISTSAFEDAWRANCLGAFLVGRSAARVMKAAAAGSIFFVGSTSSILGRAGHLNLAVGKFGQRAIAQVLARELWPHGVHVAHVLVDADIAEDDKPADPSQALPDDIALSLLHLHRQPRSAWTSEMDLRPWREQFWEHC